MANVIYTSKTVNEAAAAAVGASGQREKLDSLALKLKENSGIKLYICELFGRRWSAIGGLDEMVVPEERIELNESYGLIMEGSNLAPEELEELKGLILNILSRSET